MTAPACGGETRPALARRAMELCYNRTVDCPERCAGFVPNAEMLFTCWACEHFIDGPVGGPGWCDVAQDDDGLGVVTDYMPARWLDPACVLFESDDKEER